MVFAATIWYQWLAWALMIGTALAMVGLVIGYLVKVESPRFPKRQLR